MLSQTDFGALGSGLVCALGGSGIMPRKCEMFYWHIESNTVFYRSTCMAKPGSYNQAVITCRLHVAFWLQSVSRVRSGFAFFFGAFKAKITNAWLRWMSLWGTDWDNRRDSSSKWWLLKWTWGRVGWLRPFRLTEVLRIMEHVQAGMGQSSVTAESNHTRIQNSGSAGVLGSTQ